MTEKKLNIYQRINKVMEEVNYVVKEDKKVNNAYRFVSHDKVTAVLHGPLTKHGIVFVPTVDNLTQDGNRVTVEMRLSFVNMDNPEDEFSIISYGQGIDNQDKGIGKAVSYAVKYGLLKVFCLETGDDVERDSIDYKETPITKDQVEHLNYLIDGNQDLLDRVLKWQKVDTLDALTEKSYKVISNELQKYKERGVNE